MKKITILLFLVFINSMNGFSQTDDFTCGTLDDNTPDPSNAYSYAFDEPTLSLFEPIVIDIFFWGINRDDGTSNNMLTEAMALKGIADLNIKYNEANVFFKYKGLDYINNTLFYDLHDSVMGDFNSQIYNSNNPDVYNNTAINIYVPYNTSSWGGLGDRFRRYVILGVGSLISTTSRVLTHEMGHVFNLQHTHLAWNSDDNTQCEHVTRDPLDLDDENDPFDTYFNATTKGDRVVDTAAVPDFRNEKCDNDGMPYPYTDCPEGEDKLYFYLDEDTCTYSNFIDGDDCQGTPYDIDEDDVRNLMAYTYGSCGLELTTGQYIRMREYMLDNPSTMSQISTNDVSSLYEPYRGEYYVSGPSTSHNSPLFQPGFDYRFVDCSGNQPTPYDYNDISFTSNNNINLAVFNKNELDYNSITHPNHSAILIKHEIGNVFFPQARKCYDNFNKASSGGLIMKFNDNVINANVTIIPQDSTEINHPNLIQNLDNGLYKIEKNYEDGEVEQTIIIKEQ